jgi:hypothetical protein
VRRAATTLLGVMALMSAGCYSRSSTMLMARDASIDVYTAVLGELRRESRADWVLVDTLLPMTALDRELRNKVITELPATRRMIDAFIEAQHRTPDTLSAVVLRSVPWSAISPRQLDSLRAGVRSEALAAAAPRSARNDAFWRAWQRQFPATAGYLIVSPASVTDNGRSALIHVTSACGSICGETELRLLQRDDGGEWRTARRLRLSER